jgi:hypothetical protein
MIQLLRRTESRCDEIAFMKEAAGHTYGEVISTGAPLPQRFMAVDTHFLLIAIGATLRTSKKLLSKTGDHRLTDARREFDEAFPHAEDLRDIAEHLEAYAIGEGWLQGDREPEETRVRSDSASFWLQFDERFDPDCTTWINFSDSRRMDLRAAADRAIGLATLMEQIEVEYAERHGHGPWV